MCDLEREMAPQRTTKKEAIMAQAVTTFNGHTHTHTCTPRVQTHTHCITERNEREIQRGETCCGTQLFRKPGKRKNWSVGRVGSRQTQTREKVGMSPYLLRIQRSFKSRDS